MADDERGDPNGNLSQKLQYIRRTQRGLGNRILPYEEIAKGVTKATGRRCGEDYIEKLFTGQRTRHPDQERLEAILAQFDKTLADLEDRGDPEGTFGQRLQHLRYQYGQEHLNGKLPTPEQIAEHVRKYTKRSCTEEYIRMLLKDRDPQGLAKDKLEALADYFGVSAAFFFDDEQSRADQEKLAAQREFLDALQEWQNVFGDLQGVALRKPDTGRAPEPADLRDMAAHIRASVKSAQGDGTDPGIR
ncbi:hypothetical protein CFP71_40685 [Amycolatopsis thailandensis]|uniref:Uncharacterized protein n=1 Tax=Amycolatopsis thailandensis TaxID=589330 RepID=A0A229RC74_9PSEU|nr:hypothetical protein [Amycolatopsis thailandensis]OXM44273.1 hypothetical protein CFP71_40685 [Amycolatopsis thailandensis]